MKSAKMITIMLLCAVLFNLVAIVPSKAIAEVLPNESVYVIYDESGEYLFERINVSVGDEYIDKELNSYEVIFIDESTKTGRAKYIKSYKMPKLKEKKETSIQANAGISRGTIGLYMTHNDESYISGDGYDSVYGKGGIHDVSKMLATCLRAKSVDVVLDETLHIPHDTNAYARSSVTCKRLLSNYNLDGLFDIHRDGASRGFYVTNVNGKEHCMVRMVIGKANPNFEDNKGFALYLMSVSQIYCPWLFVDIYMAKGHYNQALKDNMVLFEFGSHLVEKDLVLKTVPDFATVLSAALFGEFEEQKNENSSQNQQSEESINQYEDGANFNEEQDQNLQQNDNTGNSQDNPNLSENSEKIGENDEKIIKNSEKSTKNSNFDTQNAETVNNLNDENTTNFLKGESSFIIIVFVLSLLVGYVVLVSIVKRKNKKE